MSAESPPPKVMLSYSWDSEEHRNWVKELATELRNDGIDVVLDQWENRPGSDLPAFMERAIRESQYVVIICTPPYKERSDGRKGGVGYEGCIMTAEAFKSGPSTKFIPILREGDWMQVAPGWLAGKVYLDFRGKFPRDYGDLVAALHGKQEQAPPIGAPPPPAVGSARPPSIVQRDAQAQTPSRPKLSPLDLAIALDERIAGVTSVNLEEAAAELGATVEEIKKALKTIERQGGITIRAMGDTLAQITHNLWMVR